MPTSNRKRSSVPPNGTIPYRRDALTRRQLHYRGPSIADPSLKCYQAWWMGATRYRWDGDTLVANIGSITDQAAESRLFQVQAGARP